MVLVALIFAFIASILAWTRNALSLRSRLILVVVLLASVLVMPDVVRFLTYPKGGAIDLTATRDASTFAPTNTIRDDPETYFTAPDSLNAEELRPAKEQGFKPIVGTTESCFQCEAKSMMRAAMVPYEFNKSGSLSMSKRGPVGGQFHRTKILLPNAHDADSHKGREEPVGSVHCPKSPPWGSLNRGYVTQSNGVLQNST